ncbi:hypothetical protein [Micromonospora zhanjiangensis]|uniref:Uncharacterized protein n=1 Tax=Micromonospora zhanjiangensis TaxID=1522057 RepID=A0ABV8KF27_9ACTN
MRRSVPAEPSPSARRSGALTAATWSPPQWRLLVRLPGRVIVATTSVAPGDPGRTVIEGLAGLDGIAAGRANDCDLVRSVVAAIYAESDDGWVPAGDDDPTTRRTEVLVACRSATRILAGRVDPADSAAYRQWVQTVAARVCRAAGDGPDPDGTGAEQRRFLRELGRALRLG